MKTCFKCGIEKPIEEFYVHPLMKDGHINKCIECTKLDVKSNYRTNSVDPDWKEKERGRTRDKYYRLNYKETQKTDPEVAKKSRAKYKEKFPEKISAQVASQHMVIPDGFEKHHWSYNTKHHKDVLILTKRDHMCAHRFMIYDQERMMYRTLEGVLLDTKESHEEYVNKYILP